MRDNNWKEVWFSWDGDVSIDMSFISTVEKVKFYDGSYLIVDRESPYRHKPIVWYLWGAWCKSGVMAYTTGLMRRRVECGSGCRYGCSCCNGKGYVWEYKDNG